MPKSSYRRDRPHARIYAHWRDLAGWKSLSLAARVLLIEMMWEYRPDPGNNGYLRWPIRKAANAVGCGKATASTALNELEACGWVTCHQVGGFGKKNRGSEYALNMFINDRLGLPASFAFELWQPSPHVVRARSARVRPQGRSSPSSRTNLYGAEDNRAGQAGLTHVSEALRKSPVFKGSPAMTSNSSDFGNHRPTQL